MGAPGTNAMQLVVQLSREHLCLLESDSLASHQAGPTNATIGPGRLQPSLWSLWSLLHTCRRHHPLPLLAAGRTAADHAGARYPIAAQGRCLRRHPRWRTRIKRAARHGSRGPPPTPPPRSRAPSRGPIRIPGGDRQGVRRPTPQRLEAAACGARLHGGDRRRRRGRGRLLLTETWRGDQ